MRLAVDTSTPIASVALEAGGHVYEREEKVTTFSERLMVLIDELFTEANASPKDLTVVVCGAGPGSFTGLRIGLSTAKGLCLGVGCKLQMVSSLEALALRAPTGSTVLTALDAFRGEIYAAEYEIPFNIVRAPFSALPTDIASTAAFAIGDAFQKYPAAIPPNATVIHAAPRARELLALSADRGFDDPRTAAPAYIRASAPEEAASKKA
jgi:tRNA threonylcarbamoyladenosine biosynthesis protein TsaB